METAASASQPSDITSHRITIITRVPPPATSTAVSDTRVTARSQVQNHLLKAFAVFAAEFPLIARRSAARMLPLAVEKVGAKQTKLAAVEAMNGACEACGPTCASCTFEFASSVCDDLASRQRSCPARAPTDRAYRPRLPTAPTAPTVNRAARLS